MKYILRHFKQTKNPRGFTLIELTLSIAFYTFIIMTALAGFIGIFGIYNKSQALSRTQLQSRTAMDTLVRDLRNTESRTYSSLPTGKLALDPLAGRLSAVYCLSSSTGFVKGYAALYVPDTDRMHLIRMINCDTSAGYEMLIGPDTWLDLPLGGNIQVGKLRAADLDDGLYSYVPFKITQLNAGSTPAVWEVVVAAHRGVRDKSTAAQVNLADQFSAETTLKTAVTTRK